MVRRRARVSWEEARVGRVRRAHGGAISGSSGRVDTGGGGERRGGEKRDVGGRGESRHVSASADEEAWEGGGAVG